MNERYCENIVKISHFIFFIQQENYVYDVPQKVCRKFSFITYVILRTHGQQIKKS